MNFLGNMMDEQLIDEVAQHAVIFNRQKYYLNGSSNGNGSMSANKYETKCEAWQSISMKLRSDVETCKKRWKYLRERYVSQRKQGDPPVYEHLSRPYLEKMKFLDSHIQPRKSYRNVPNFLTSPHSANSSNFNDYNMDSKSNSSMKSMGNFGQHGHHFPDQQHAMNALSSAAAAASAMEGESRVKLEADQVFRDFAAAVASQHLQQISQTQMHHQQSAAAAAAMVADSSQNYTDHFRDAAGSVVAGSQNNGAVAGGGGNSTAGLHSNSSSIKSPLSSPLGAGHHNGGATSAGHSMATAQQATAHTSTPNNTQGNVGPIIVTANSSHHFNNHSFNDAHNDDLDSSTSSNYNMKKPRVQLNSNTPNSSTSSQLNHNNTGHTNSHHMSHNNHNANNSHFGDDSDDDDTDDNGTSLLQPQILLSEHHTADNPFQSMNSAASTSSAAAAAVALQRSQNSNSSQQSPMNNSNSSQTSPSNMFSSNADFLFQLYQQLPQHHHNSNHHQQQHNSNGGNSQQFNKFQVPPTPPLSIQRSSEHLLGELVTTELLKMSKDRRKNVQKRILEILFFDD